jgi:hypothetical protein
MKLDLLTNATVVDDAIRFVASEKSKDKDREQVKNSSSSESNSEDDKESKEADYDYDDEKSDKGGEEKQEQQTGEITVNQVF